MSTVTLPQGSVAIGNGGLEFEILPNKAKTVVLTRYQGQEMNMELTHL